MGRLATAAAPVLVRANVATVPSPATGWDARTEPGLMTLIVDLYVAWLMERCALSRVKANVLDHHPVSATVLQWCP